MAALPMRINVCGRSGVLVLHQGQLVPSATRKLSDPTFLVNRTDEPTPTSPISSAPPTVWIGRLRSTRS